MLSLNEQMSLSIRWVDSNYNIREDTLGLMQLLNAKAERILSIIKDILIRCSSPIKQCCGQADGDAANMSGCHCLPGLDLLTVNYMVKQDCTPRLLACKTLKRISLFYLNCAIR